MSGRVRWERSKRWPECTYLVVGVEAVGEAFAWSRTTNAVDYKRDAHAPFRRRSDAKRWLLARAAGLAEVPRWQRVKRGGVEDGDARRPPKGWRRLTTVEIGGDPVSVYERNRRRR